MTEPFPARIHVLLATEAPVGLVIRRGPARQVCTLLWDRTTDTFQIGQWFKGRIYERWSDITPDGKYWVYFALKWLFKSKSVETWTAVARVPYLKALTLHSEFGTWTGGGYFTRDGQQWVHRGYPVPTLSDEDASSEASEITAEEGVGDIPRPLERGGWVLSDEDAPVPPDFRLTYVKPIGAGWVLRKLVYPRREEHQLVHGATRAVVSLPNWEWADLDGERVVWAEAGKLFAADVEEGALMNERLLHDFNDMKFEAIAAPY